MGEESMGMSEEIMQKKGALIDSRTISKNIDQSGRDALAAQLIQSRQLNDEINETRSRLEERQKGLFVKLKNVLHIPDQQTIDLQAKQLELNTREGLIPKPKMMVEAYYEKIAETPLTNQEKRELLRPDVLSELSTEEYVALWRRLNPHFLANVTRQGFRDHSGGDAMVSHTRGVDVFDDGFINVMKNEKRLFPLIARDGLVSRDEQSVRVLLNKGILQSENEAIAKSKFESTLHDSMGSAPCFPDKTATHLASQLVSDRFYGGEVQNEVFFLYPSDVLASQYAFAFNGRDKDFTKPQSETKWNDVFIWTDPNKPGIPVDAGMVFLPENTPVDPESGSKYASETKTIEGQTVRVMVENEELVNRFESWARSLNSESPIIKAMTEANLNNDSSDYEDLLIKEMTGIGVPEDSMVSLLKLSGLQQDLYLTKGKDVENYIEAFRSSNAKWKRSENTVSSKEYWEDLFSKNPDLRPKHVVYYDGDPTSAVYRFQQNNEIGGADTSKNDGNLLGFDDHHVVDMENDPRSNQGLQELVDLGNRIITEHYQASSTK